MGDPAPQRASPRGGTDGPSTVLLAPASNVLFHVGRCVRLARELARRGHRAILAGTPRYLGDPALASGPGVERLDLPDFGPEEAMALLRSVLARPPAARIAGLVRAEREALERLRPDLVVCDFRPSMALSARAEGLPLASLLLGHWTPEYADAPEWVPRSYAVTEGLRRVLGEGAGLRLAAPVFRRAVRFKSGTFTAAARALGQPRAATLFDLLQGELDLLTDVEELCPVAARPGRLRVGPILWEPDGPLPDWAERLDPERPVVFVNFGSTAHPDLFRRTVEAFADGEHQLAVATCGQVEPEALARPPRVFAERFLPVARMAERADLVVYHGGAGTFQQTLLAGTPGLVIATHWDQEHAGVVSERLGLGRFLTMGEVLRRPARLRAAADRMLADLPRHRGHAERLRQVLQKYDGPRLAADALEDLLRRRGAPGPGAPSRAA